MAKRGSTKRVSSGSSPDVSRRSNPVSVSSIDFTIDGWMPLIRYDDPIPVVGPWRVIGAGGRFELLTDFYTGNNGPLIHNGIKTENEGTAGGGLLTAGVPVAFEGIWSLKIQNTSVQVYYRRRD